MLRNDPLMSLIYGVTAWT